MPSRLRKTQTLWGHWGHDHMSKHWKRGGQSNAGDTYHHMINFDQYHSGYSGNAGMRHEHLKKNQSFCPSVNLDKWQPSISEWVNATRNKPRPAPIPVVVRSGYYEVLGKGNLPKQPVIVKAKFL
uniref:Large ribosomal subunit protein uL15 n=1 Tax=Mustela putorius furo TaxID=9669 RepID=M3Y4J9_MUSPF